MQEISQNLPGNTIIMNEYNDEKWLAIDEY